MYDGAAAETREEDRQALKGMQAMIAQHLAKGGQVTQCPPGSSEEVIYKSTFRGRAAAKSSGQHASKAGVGTDAKTT